MELANLILISYHKNLSFVESMSAYGKEPPGLFTDSLMCCDNSDFNEESPEHHASQSY